MYEICQAQVQLLRFFAKLSPNFNLSWTELFINIFTFLTFLWFYFRIYYLYYLQYNLLKNAKCVHL